MLLITKEKQLKRWEEHFPEIFNTDDNRVGSKQEMRNVEGNSENESEVNLDPPTKTEIQLALSQLNNGKAEGFDNIYISESTKSLPWNNCRKAVSSTGENMEGEDPWGLRRRISYQDTEERRLIKL